MTETKFRFTKFSQSRKEAAKYLKSHFLYQWALAVQSINGNIGVFNSHNPLLIDINDYRIFNQYTI